MSSINNKQTNKQANNKQAKKQTTNKQTINKQQIIKQAQLFLSNLLCGEGPPRHFPNNESEGVHVGSFERLEAGLVQSLIQHLQQVV